MRSKHKKQPATQQTIKYLRIAVFSIDEVLPFVMFEKDGSPKKGNRDRMYGEHSVHMNSLRYRTFLVSGVTCVKCGLVGTFFALERPEWPGPGSKGNPNGRYHFNLYGVDSETGEDILITKDHIVPVSKGGKSNIANLQTMCCRCNFEKGNQQPSG